MLPEKETPPVLEVGEQHGDIQHTLNKFGMYGIWKRMDEKNFSPRRRRLQGWCYGSVAPARVVRKFQGSQFCGASATLEVFFSRAVRYSKGFSPAN